MSESTLSADVIVIGAGLVGRFAAIEAAQDAARVLVLERQQAVGGYQSDERLVEVHCLHQADTLRRLRRHGVRFGSVQVAAGQSVPRQHPANPREPIRLLAQVAAAMPGIRLLTWAPVDRSLRARDGRVHAVRASVAGRPVTVPAHRGMVLTSGGFSRNEWLRAQFAPGQARAIRVGGAGNAGDGLGAARQLGAGPTDMGHVKGTFGDHPAAGCRAARGDACALQGRDRGQPRRASASSTSRARTS